ncbi:MAG: hypothetical protein R2881_05625 [Eubacteriales bacterium]
MTRGYDVPDVLTEEQIAEYGYDEDGNLIMEKEPIYDSVAAFESVYGLDAFEFKNDHLKCVEVKEENNIVLGKTLRSNYLTSDNLRVNVIEQWYTGDGQSVFFGGEIKQRIVLDGRTMKYSNDTANDPFDGFVLLENSVLAIYADAELTLI